MGRGPERRQQAILREHYYGMSSQARRYLMGKDNGLRIFFEATGEQDGP